MKVKVLILWILLTNAINLFSNDFEQVATPYKYIHKVKFLEDNLMVISGDSAFIDLTTFNPFIHYLGAGYYISSDMGQKYTGPFLEGTTVLDIVRSRLKNDRFYAVASKFGRTGIYESNDNGKTWSFMPKHEETSIMHKILLLNEGNTEILNIANLNSSEGLIIMPSNFQNPIKPNTIKSQVYDIKYNPKLKTIFLSSDHDEYGKVIRFSAQKTEKEIKGLENLRVLSIQPSTHNPAFVYAGVDSLTFNKVAIGKGIFMSIDTGKTWKYLTGNGMRVFDIQEHPLEPSYMAAAMGTGGVGISSNFGQYFEIYRGGLPKDAEVRSVAFPSIQIDAVGAVVFAATLMHGLYKSRPLISTARTDATTENQLTINKVVQSPISNEINIEYYNQNAENVELMILNSLGKKVFVSDLGVSRQGINQISIYDVNFSDGVYFVILKTQSSAASHKFIIIK